MKLERLLGIITYLLNRDVLSGKELAEKFEVSERTIQRDIESINMAGIPIVSLRGSNGGYKIMDHYRFSKQTASDHDLKILQSALIAWNSTHEQEMAKKTLEKVNSLVYSKDSISTSIDLSIVKENKKLMSYLPIIEQSIQQKTRIEFSYTNASNEVKHHVIEPIQLKFKWYSWYLIGYHCEKQQYRVYKLCRINELNQLSSSFSTVHCNQTDYFELVMQNDTREMISLTLKIQRSSFVGFTEYFNTYTVISEDEETFTISTPIIKTERKWFAFVLSFGDSIEVLYPISIRDEIIHHSKKILNLYNKPDT